MTDFSGWSHFQDITIAGGKVGSTGAPHANITLAVDGADLTVLARAKDDGSDVRVALTDGTELSHVRLSRGSYISRDGHRTWYNLPVAIYDATGNGALYSGDFNGTNDGYVRCRKWDYGTKTLTGGSFDGGGNGDDHNNPAVLQRSDGKLILFAPSHNIGDYTLPYRISTTARDPTAWGAEKTVTGWTANGNGVSYAQAWRLSSESSGQKIWLFSREKASSPALNRWVYSTSTDDGDTFASIAPFWSGGSGPYLLSISNGSNRIDFFASYSNPSDGDGKAVYHFYYQASDATFRGSDGSLCNTDGSIPAAGFTAATLPAASKILDGADADPDDNVWNASINYNSNGDPVVLLIVYKGGSLSTTEVHWGEYDSGWSTEKIGDWSQLSTGSPEYPPLACVDPSVAKGAAICFEVSGNEELQLWRDTGSGWTKTTDVTSGGSAPNYRPFATYNHPLDGKGGEFTWCQGGFYTDFATTGANVEAGIATYPTLDADIASIRVCVPSLPSSGNTTIRFYAGNATATDSQSWSGAYVGASEVVDMSDGDFRDARRFLGRIASSAYDIQNFPETLFDEITTTVPAMQASSETLPEAVSHRVEGPALDLSGLSALTVECLFRFDSSSSNEHSILSNLTGAGGTAGFLFRADPAADNLDAFVDTSGGRMSGSTASSSIAANTDYYGALIFDGNVGGAAKLYIQINGTRTEVASAAGPRTLHATASTEAVRLFRWPTADYLIGAIGEPRIWPVAKPTGWGETVYNNFFDADFYTVGAEQSQGALLPILAAHGAYLGAN